MGERFRVGRVVARSFAIFGRELPLLLAITFVVHVPRVAVVEGLQLAQPAFPRPDPDARHDDGEFLDRLKSWLWKVVPVQVASSLADTLFTGLSLALVVFSVYARLRGRRASMGESVRGGLKRLLPVLRVSLCLWAGSAGIWLGGLLVAWKLLRAGNPGAAALAFALPWQLLLPLLLSPFWVAVPAAVVDEPRRLLRRSFALTRGHRLAVCAVVLLLYAVDWGSSRLLRTGLPALDLPRVARSAIWWAQDLVMVSLGAVFAAVGYHALRLEKEGVDASDLEQVFA